VDAEYSLTRRSEECFHTAHRHSVTDAAIRITASVEDGIPGADTGSANSDKAVVHHHEVR
jgi:hypothetical protein